MKDSEQLETGVQHEEEPTHYCEDCEGELVIIYDDRDDRDVPIVCGACGGTNTRPLAEGEA